MNTLIKILYVLTIAKYFCETADVCRRESQQCCLNNITCLEPQKSTLQDWYHSYTTSKGDILESLDPIILNKLSFHNRDYRVILKNIKIQGIFNNGNNKTVNQNGGYDYSASFEPEESKLIELKTGNTQYNKKFLMVFNNISVSLNKDVSQGPQCFGTTLVDIKPTSINVESTIDRIREAILSLDYLCLETHGNSQNTLNTRLIIHLNTKIHIDTDNNVITKDNNGNTKQNQNKESIDSKEDSKNELTPNTKVMNGISDDNDQSVKRNTTINFNNNNVVIKNVNKVKNPKHKTNGYSFTSTFTSTYTKDKNGTNVNRNSNTNININKGGVGTTSSQSTSSSKMKITGDGHNLHYYNENHNMDNNANHYHD